MDWRNSKYYRWGITALLVIVAAAIFVVILTNFEGFFNLIHAAIGVISPLIYGCVFAYLLNPLVKLIENRLKPKLAQKQKKPEKSGKLAHVLGMLFAYLVFGFVIYGMFALVLPQLYQTIAQIVTNMPFYISRAEQWTIGVLQDNPDLQVAVNTAIQKISESVQTWLSDGLLANAQAYLTGITSSVMSVVREVANMIIGLVASVYILWSKDTFQSQTKKLIVAIFRPKQADRLLHVGREMNRVFSGFIIGKIIDATIIGLLCYIGMRILKLPFPVLIATIIGVTNIIPFFGPVIGLIPSAILILFVDPLQAFYFVVFILILQQIDGNVIGPRILGDSVGLSGFWILISITIAGNLFGFAGMILGVPVFALIYVLLSEWTNNRLAGKSLTTDTDSYYDITEIADLETAIDVDPEQIRFADEEKTTEEEP